MKTLIVIRHAKSSWDDPDLSDFNRPLNERGERDAPRMAKRLKEKDLTINTVVSSPAVRAITTCKVFMKTLRFPEDQVQTFRDLYHAGDEMILNVVRKLKDHPVENEVALLFGHNPGLTEFVNNLVDEDIDNVPTTGVVCCKLKVGSWKEVKWGCGEMEFFDFPKKKEKGG
ncbi:MAG TPA: histidine phosphatase family protein [Cyclobacteriaceae bacterium]|nr:histidine phosphatase family protein [Cyclobacteriaceae bacterium]